MTENLKPQESLDHPPETDSLAGRENQALLREKMRARLEQKDRFLEHPPKQPKKDIADMLEQKGMLVPRRFENLSEALEAVEQGREIIIRSEHPQEYAGASGLLESFPLNTEKWAKTRQFCAEHGAEIDWEYFHKHFYSGDAHMDTVYKIIGSLPESDQKTFEDSIKKLSLPRIRRYCRLLGLDTDTFMQDISYSYWEKIGGFNRSIVADSAIPGRYHIFSSRGY